MFSSKLFYAERALQIRDPLQGSSLIEKSAGLSCSSAVYVGLQWPGALQSDLHGSGMTFRLGSQQQQQQQQQAIQV